jgi:hypothetical protein
MPDKYLSLAEKEYFTDKEDGQEGTMTLIGPHPAGTIELPAIGAACVIPGLGINAATCLLRSRVKSQHNADARYKQWVLSYSTKAVPNPTPTDVSEREQSIGGEMQSIDKPSGWVWSGSTAAITIPVPSRIITATFSVPTKELTSGQDALLKQVVIDYGGMINELAYDGWGVGNVMYLGNTGGTGRNKAGAQIWKYKMNFSVRVIPEKATDGWLYIMREDGIWDMPKKSDGTFLFKKFNFTTVLGGYVS